MAFEAIPIIVLSELKRDWTDRGNRSVTRHALTFLAKSENGHFVRDPRENGTLSQSWEHELFGSVIGTAEGTSIVNAWRNVREYRNSINHAGLEDERKPGDFDRSLREALESVRLYYDGTENR